MIPTNYDCFSELVWFLFESNGFCQKLIFVYLLIFYAMCISYLLNEKTIKKDEVRTNCYNLRVSQTTNKNK